MKISCDVIKDMLPLYTEDMVSNDTKELVESHISLCPDCAAARDNLCCELKVPAEIQSPGLVRVKNAIQTKRRRAVWQVIFAMLFIPLFLFWALTLPFYIPSDRAMEKVYVDENGTLAYKFREGVYSFDFCTHKAVGEQKETKHIVAYVNFWTWYYNMRDSKDPGGYLIDTTTNTPINTERVLYGCENACLWGNPQHKDIHYECYAIATTMLTAVIFAVINTIQYRKKPDRKNKYLKCSIFFWCYVIVNLLVLKFDLRLYSIMFHWSSLIFFGVVTVLSLLLYGIITMAIENRRSDL